MASTKSTPVYPQESYQSNILGAEITTFALATIAVLLRFIARRLQKFDYWLDDWLILVAWVCSIGMVFAIVRSVTDGGLGLHADRVTPQQNQSRARELFIDEIFYSTVLSVTKLSVLAFYWRIFRVPSIQLPIKILTVLTFGWFIGRMVAVFLQCIPIQGFWDPTVKAHCGVDVQKFFFGTALTHLCLDIALVTLPIYYIRNLHITKAQKRGIYAIYLVLLFMCVSPLLQVIASATLDFNTKDPSWVFAPTMMWAGIEVNMSVFSACLPSLRPIFLYLGRFHSETVRPSIYNYRYGSESGRRSESKISKSHASKDIELGKTESTQYINTSNDNTMVQTVTSYKANATFKSNDASNGEFDAGGNKIMVKDEVLVHSSSAK